jgi:hypothetical protein
MTMNCRFGICLREVAITTISVVLLGASAATSPSTQPRDDVHVFFRGSVAIGSGNVFLEGYRRETMMVQSVGDAAGAYRRDVLEVRKASIEPSAKPGKSDVIYRYLEIRSGFPPQRLQADMVPDSDGMIYLVQAEGRRFEIVKFGLDATPVGQNGELNFDGRLPANANQEQVDEASARALARHYSRLGSRYLGDDRSAAITTIKIQKLRDKLRVTLRVEKEERDQVFVWSLVQNSWQD